MHHAAVVGQHQGVDIARGHAHARSQAQFGDLFDTGGSQGQGVGADGGETVVSIGAQRIDRERFVAVSRGQGQLGQAGVHRRGNRFARLDLALELAQHRGPGGTDSYRLCAGHGGACSRIERGHQFPGERGGRLAVDRRGDSGMGTRRQAVGNALENGQLAQSQRSWRADLVALGDDHLAQAGQLTE